MLILTLAVYYLALLSTIPMTTPTPAAMANLTALGANDDSFDDEMGAAPPLAWYLSYSCNNVCRRVWKKDTHGVSQSVIQNVQVTTDLRDTLRFLF